MKSSAVRCENSSSKGMTTSSSTPRPVDHVALHRERVDQLRRRRRAQHLERVRLEGEHGVGALDHRPVAEVDAVEGADRDVAGARLGLVQRGDLDRHQSRSAPHRSASRDRPGPAPRPGDRHLAARVLDPERPDRGAAQVRAVGVAERLDQRPDVGPGAAFDLVVGEPVAAGEQLGAVHLDVAHRASRRSRRGGPSCRGARRRPGPPRSSAPAGAPSRSAAPASSGTRRSRSARRRGRRCVEVQPSRAVAR